MTLKEMYEKIGSDYAALLERLASEKLIKKLVLKYPANTSCEQLKNDLEKKDYEQAFVSCHTLKGIALNLGFDALAKCTSEMTELLRAKQCDNLEPLFESIRAEHEKVLAAISGLDGE